MNIEHNQLHNHSFTLLYDGQCPICQKEVAWLSRFNKQGKLGLKDINDIDFNPSQYGKTFEQLMAEIHGVFPDGLIIKGMPVFREAYRAVGLGWLMAPTAWPVLKQLFDGFYGIFAKYRLTLGRVFGAKRCQEERCRIPK
jgi:predicted DCC family thiol-disulfide oxidoreductase YuxK